MLNVDYGTTDEAFWDVKNERSLTLSQAVEEGYFKSFRAAKKYYDAISGDDEEDDDN